MIAGMEKIEKMIKSAHARIVKAVEEQTTRHDHAAGLLSPMDCSKCEKSYSFSGVIEDCTNVGTGPFGERKSLEYQTILSGYVCGNPTNDTWAITRVDYLNQQGGGSITNPVTCAPAGSQLEKQYVQEARRTDFQGKLNHVCIYKDDSSPQITIKVFRQHASESHKCENLPEETATIVAVQVRDKCDDNQVNMPDGPAMTIW